MLLYKQLLPFLGIVYVYVYFFFGGGDVLKTKRGREKKKKKKKKERERYINEPRELGVKLKKLKKKELSP